MALIETRFQAYIEYDELGLSLNSLTRKRFEFAYWQRQIDSKKCDFP